jgi:ketosteroid isomerase-like protein
MRMRSLLITLAAAAACRSRTAPVPAIVRDPARDSVFHQDQARGDSAALHGSTGAMLALLASDAAYLRAGAPAAYGIDAIRELLSASPDSPGTKVSWQPLGGGISDDLRSAYTFGVTARAIPSSPIRFERYIAYWSRDKDQPWRIVAYAEIDGPVAPEPTVIPDMPPPAEARLPKALAEARKNVRAADSAFADLGYRMGTAFAFSNSVAPEGVLFGNPQLVIGPRAIDAFLSGRGGESSLSWHPVFAAVAGSRDLGYTIGEYTSTGRGPTGAAVQHFGKYLTVWKRQSNGTWKFVVDGGNGSPGRQTGN